MKKILFLVSILLVSIVVSAQQETDSQQADAIEVQENQEEPAMLETGSNVSKAEADSAYAKNDFTQAIQLYEALLTQGEAAEVYYNLGNSYYKTEDIARAILNYERALLLQPGNTDIRANLEIARAKTVDKIVPIPEIFFVAWINSLINTMSVDAWAGVGIVSFMLFLIALGSFLYSKVVAWKKSGFIAAIVLLMVVVLSNIFAWQQKSELQNRDEAIVLTPSVTVRSTPSESGTGLFILHEGCKLLIKDDTMREWKEIMLEDGKVGWVPASTIEVI